ncbi:MAG: immune inhibitor A [Chloroflexi bacterium]|nr:immune inhibitor A [Chloroflexota bacterium]MCI0581212.1 immune inhibitor A [Chloroflexota bacterium]MCI0644071.1 immune inhibitor A [Chloroflexota bacterium]MCI0727887.1 immune inhibitor A [Chloroflexota bacterium]
MNWYPRREQIPFWLRLLATVSLLALSGLACQTLLGGRPTASPVTPGWTPVAATPVAGATEVQVEVTPSPTFTGVPAQTRTATAPSGAPTADSGQSGAWPTPVGLPEPFAATAVSAAQQQSFDLLVAANPPERDDLELARAYQGWNGELGPVATAAAPLEVGVRQQINVLNHDNNTITPIEAELRAVGEHAYFWFDTGPGSFEPDAGDLANTRDAFDGIYEQSVAIFGPESNPGVDGDSRVHVVNASPLALCQVTLGTADQCGLAGYFSSFDGIPATVDPMSNAREMFVMNADYFGSNFYLNVLAHEFRHMIEDNYDQGDTDWEAEGSAMLAEELLGFSGNGVARANLFLTNPDQQLNRWTDQDTIPYYGQGYLFNRYIYDRLGQELYRQFAASPDSGLMAIDSVATANGLDITGQGLWLDWLVALGIHGRPNAPEEYQFQTSGLDMASMLPVTNFPSAYETTVRQYGADYFRLRGDEEVNVQFTGSTLAPLLDVAAASGEHMWLANRANYSHMRLTRSVDLTGVEEATFYYDVYHDIEAGYDFAYLFVSQDGGQTWQSLTAEHMQGLQPADDPSDSALAERFYTGRSQQWQSEIVDLTPFAGQVIQLRFVYVTDPILTFGGLAVDNLAIPEIGFYDDAEQPVEGWLAEGFARVATAVPQQWHLTLITFPNGEPVIAQESVPGGQSFTRPLSLADSEGEAILIVAASAPMTLELGHYRLEITP